MVTTVTAIEIFYCVTFIQLELHIIILITLGSASSLDLLSTVTVILHGWMELMATICITYNNLLYMFVWVAFNKQTDKFEYSYVFFIFVFPWLFTWVPFTVDAFGRAGAWCWIRNEDIYTCKEIIAGQVLQFVLWYIPLYIILPILIVLYVIILVKIYCYKRRRWSWNQTHEDSHQQKKITRQIWSLLRYTP